jgi:hypothetical protein
MNTYDGITWGADWASSLPLIAINVVFHVFGLGFIMDQVELLMAKMTGRRRFRSIFAIVMSLTAALATVLHGIEAGVWAVAYRLLDAFPNDRSAMLYSLSAMTSYGHANLFLPERWQLMGALEALNGMLLFGLTTAFMFAMIQRVSPIGRKERNRHP